MSDRAKSHPPGLPSDSIDEGAQTGRALSEPGMPSPSKSDGKSALQTSAEEDKQPTLGPSTPTKRSNAFGPGPSTPASGNNAYGLGLSTPANSNNAPGPAPSTPVDGNSQDEPSLPTPAPALTPRQIRTLNARYLRDSLEINDKIISELLWIRDDMDRISDLLRAASTPVNGYEQYDLHHEHERCAESIKAAIRQIQTAIDEMKENVDNDS